MSNRSASTLTGILVTLGFFAVLEIAAGLAFRAGVGIRTTAPEVTYPFHSYLGWVNRPNFTYTGALARGLYPWSIRTDSLGEAGSPLFEFPKPDVSVAVVGGSAVFGVGQTDNANTLPSQIERELNRRTGLRVEVHNLAVGGYTSFQEMLALERYFSMHHADIVVSISGYNDAFAAGIEPGPDFGLLLHRLDPKAEMVRSIERGGLAVVPVAGNLMMQALRRRSAAVDLLGKAADRLTARRTPPPVPWHDIPLPDSAEIVRRARLVLGNYAMMDGLAKQRDARFFMFLQPTAMTRKDPTAEERQALDSLNTEFMARALPVVRVFYPAVVAAEKHFEFHDLGAAFDGFPEPAYADECHFRDGATATLAAAVAEVIAPAVAEAPRIRAARTAR